MVRKRFSMACGFPPVSRRLSIDFISETEGSGKDSSSYADTATLPLRHRNAKSAIPLFRTAATPAADTLGVPFKERIMFK